MSDEALVHLRALAAVTPWDSDFEAGDWCRYCFARQEDYGPKPWPGHKPDCVWVAADSWLRALTTGGSAASEKTLP